MKLIESFKNKVREKYKDASQKNIDTRIPHIITNGTSAYNRVKYFPAYGQNCKYFIRVNNQKSFNEMLKENPAYHLVKEIDIEHIQKQKIHLNIIGYGGFMANMMYFIHMLLKEERPFLFEKTNIYETDNLALMNIFRIYQDVMHIRAGTNQVSYQEIDKKYLFLEEMEYLNYYMNIVKRKNHYYRKVDLKEDELYLSEKNILNIGSPIFETREEASDSPIPFFFFGHSKNEGIIVKNPKIDSFMAVETYGTMDVLEFYQVVLTSAINFLYVLSQVKYKDIKSLKNNTKISECFYSERTKQGHFEFTPEIKTLFTKNTPQSRDVQMSFGF